MTMPQQVLSTSAIVGQFIGPYDRPAGRLEDWERGGIALNDTSEGSDYQNWRMTYNGDRDSPTYGDFTIEAMRTGYRAVVLQVDDVVEMAFAFDQNMNLFIVYVLDDCTVKHYWYDTFLASYTTTTMASGVSSPACCKDDHRATQDGTSDIILAYIRAGNLYMRQERDRYTVEYLLLASVGMTRIERIGLTRKLRLQIQLDSGSAVTLSRIVKDIADMVGVDRVILDQLDDITVRGFLCADNFSAADAIKTLQRIYFFDMPEINGFLHAQLRGGEVIATIDLSDQVLGHEIQLETAREQAVEFPYKLHLAYASAESEYTPTKATSERRALDMPVYSEITVEAPINLAADEAQQRADVLHKIAWNEQELKAKFGLDESWKYLVPSSLVNVEIYSGTYKRMRVDKATFAEGVYYLELKRDRQSAYTSLLTAAGRLAASAPPGTVPAATDWEYMDLPALLTSHDDLRFYVAAKGADSSPAQPWFGSHVQRQIGTDWETEARAMIAETMGASQAATAIGSVHIPDTTNTVLVSLNNAPESITDALLYSGRGAWLFGDEIIQVRDWVAEGAYWRGSHLLRGRLDTTAAAHTSAERFVFLGNPVSVGVDVGLLDTTVTLRAMSVGGTVAASAGYAFAGKSQEEWAPERLTAVNASSPLADWSLSWVPRYRLGNSANPIPSTNFYGWIVRFTAGSPAVTVAKVVDSTTPAYTYTAADQVTDFGAVQAGFDSVEIRALNWLGGEGKALTGAIAA